MLIKYLQGGILLRASSILFPSNSIRKLFLQIFLKKSYRTTQNSSKFSPNFSTSTNWSLKWLFDWTFINYLFFHSFKTGYCKIIPNCQAEKLFLTPAPIYTRNVDLHLFFYALKCQHGSKFEQVQTVIRMSKYWLSIESMQDNVLLSIRMMNLVYYQFWCWINFSWWENRIFIENCKQFH